MSVDDFRDFFKPEKEKKDYCINDVIVTTLEMLNPTYSQYDLCAEFNNEVKFYSNGFPNELGQVLVNIVNNAKDALVEQQIKNKEIIITIEPSVNTEKYQFVIKILDNAGGIPIAIKDKIFEPYFTTKDKKNGSGLGLYMTKMIIERHMQGQLNVENKADGTVFEISLMDTEILASDIKEHDLKEID